MLFILFKFDSTLIEERLSMLIIFPFLENTISKLLPVIE
jgi:hypothetical protein